MQKSIKVILSLAYLLFLIPWHLSEKVFEYLLQPLVFRKYRVELSKGKRLVSRLVGWSLPLLVLAYVGRTGYQFYLRQGNLVAAAKNGLDLPVTIYNDFAKATPALLSPLNTVLLYKQGGEVGWPRLLLSIYLLILPPMFICNLGFHWVSTSRSLSRAVKLRNQAIRDVNIVRFAEGAKNDEVFFGIDINRNGAPFFAKTKWLQGHVQVIGSPGSGKTESIVQPLWYQAVRRNIPTIVLDGKASRQNIDKFFTIASSLAQGHEIIYFNPADPDRSATYNPLRRGTVAEIKNRLLSGLNTTPLSAHTRERLDYWLNLVLRAIKQTGAELTLHEMAQYFISRTHVHNQLRLINEKYVYDGISELLKNFQAFQTETACFIELLEEIEHSEYAWLLDTKEPELDILDFYTGRKDCYFTLPIGPGDAAMSFLGQLIIGDILATFHHLSLQKDAKSSDGLLVIDEVAKFVTPQFIELLRASRNIGVSVCYTNQSLAEMENPDLHLTRAFTDQLADHTNVVFCFHLGSPESIAGIINRIGPESKIEEQPAKPAAGKKGEAKAAPKEIVIDPKFLKHLEVGRCVAFVRQPRVLGILKTGYFKFDQILPYARRDAEEKSNS